MDCKNRHQEHEHTHGPGCGHTAIRHGNETGYLHDGHLHLRHGDHFDETQVGVSDTNPENCTRDHTCSGHNIQHKHGPDCGHQQVPHGDHTDYLVGDHLHHDHEGHCDDHGFIEVQIQKAA